MTALPPWAALIVALLLVIAGLATFIGSLGLLRLPTFFQRMHAPTLGLTLGAFGMAVASVLTASLLGGRPLLHPLLISLFLFLTAPVSAILLMQSARQERD